MYRRNYNLKIKIPLRKEQLFDLATKDIGLITDRSNVLSIRNKQKTLNFRFVRRFMTRTNK